jgi:hypothetical protein
MQKCIPLILLLLISIITSVEAQNANPAPAPAVDWFARIVSVVAILIGLGGLILNLLSRWDKSREHDPSVDIDLTKTSRMAEYDFELKIINRGDVSLQVVSLQCKHGALEPDDAEVSKDGTTADYNGFRIDGRKDETFVGTYKCEFSFAGPEEFIVVVRINDHQQRLRKRTLIRDLP